jgi:hypothetical protein
MRTYSQRTCRCGKKISAAGLPWYNHMMGHVRRGEATVTRTLYDFLQPEHIEFTWIKGVKCQPNKSR